MPRRALALSLVAVLALTTRSVVTGQPEDERQVKALFLFNFAKFVDWPPDLPAGPICMAVVGDARFSDILVQTVSGKTVNGQSLVVKRVADTPPKDCHIVFVSGSDRRRITSTLEALKGSAVLTVGECRGFAQTGGVINFEIVNNKVRFEVNVDAAERARLKLSSKLLSLAKIVHDGGA